MLLLNTFSAEGFVISRKVSQFPYFYLFRKSLRHHILKRKKIRRFSYKIWTKLELGKVFFDNYSFVINDDSKWEVVKSAFGFSEEASIIKAWTFKNRTVLSIEKVFFLFQASFLKGMPLFIINVTVLAKKFCKIVTIIKVRAENSRIFFLAKPSALIIICYPKYSR